MQAALPLGTARMLRARPPFSLPLDSWLATFVLNFPWLPVLLWADYGAPILRGRVPV